jgi:hypothetical protein
MFVGDEVILGISFGPARARLANLAHHGSLTSVSEGAYGDGLAGLIRVGPIGAVPGVSKLVEVCFRDLVTHDDTALLTVRWEATGPGGGLFPALDADITLSPAGARATRLTLAGAYRPPLAGLGAGLDRAILHRVATATIRSLLSRMADALADPGRAADGAPAAWTGPRAAPAAPEAG